MLTPIKPGKGAPGPRNPGSSNAGPNTASLEQTGYCTVFLLPRIIFIINQHVDTVSPVVINEQRHDSQNNDTVFGVKRIIRKKRRDYFLNVSGAAAGLFYFICIPPASPAHPVRSSGSAAGFLSYLQKYIFSQSGLSFPPARWTP